MEVKKENILAAYETARKAGADNIMRVLEAMFGKEAFKPKDITERIKTFEDAYAELGEDHQFVREYSAIQRAGEVLKGGFSMDIIAYLKLRIICAALNEGRQPDFFNDECRYYPWFWLYTEQEIEDMDEKEKFVRQLIPTGDYETGYAGFASALSSNAPSDTIAHFGSRLCLKSKALAIYCGKHFINLWADLNLIRHRDSLYSHSLSGERKSGTTNSNQNNKAK